MTWLKLLWLITLGGGIRPSLNTISHLIDELADASYVLGQTDEDDDEYPRLLRTEMDARRRLIEAFKEVL